MPDTLDIIQATPMSSPAKRKRGDGDSDDEGSDDGSHGEDHVLAGNAGDESQNMDEEMTCGICMEILDNPYTIIPCLHSIDYECLVEWWKGHNTCPVCSSRAQAARKAFQIRAIVEKYLVSRPHKRREVDEEDDPPTALQGGVTPAEIKPKGHNRDIPDFGIFGVDNEVDEEAEDDDDEDAEDDGLNPARYLIWPCFCCEPGNGTGYECPNPIPEPTQEQIAAAVAAGARPPLERPGRWDFIIPLGEALARNTPGANEHAGCQGCHRYVPKDRQPEKDQCALCEGWSCAEYDPEGCPQRWTLQPRDSCSFPHMDVMGPIALHQHWMVMPQRYLSQNRDEMQIFDEYIAVSLPTVPSVLSDISRWNLQQIEEDDGASEAQVTQAKRKWGNEARFCLSCRNATVRDGLFGWWMREKATANDAAIRAKPNCWYGYECRTQMHNRPHAQKLNHVCENARGAQAGPPPGAAAPLPP